MLTLALVFVFVLMADLVTIACQSRYCCRWAHGIPIAAAELPVYRSSKNPSMPCALAQGGARNDKNSVNMYP